jgi:hypothetical protein
MGVHRNRPRDKSCALSKDKGYGLSVIAKLKETRVKRNLYYEIKDRELEETIENGVRKVKKTKTRVFGIHSTNVVRNTLIEILKERMRLHKDKFISPTIYQELRGLEVKRNGKVEHSDLTHDDQIFSYLMAMYVWYEGKNLRETFGIEKFGIKTEEAVDDIVDLATSEDFGDITEEILYATKDENDKFESDMAELNKAKGMMLDEFMAAQRKKENDRLKIMLQNPVMREAYARKYGVPADDLSIAEVGDTVGPQSSNLIPNSLFLDFNKDYTELNKDSVYMTMGGAMMDSNGIILGSAASMTEDDAVQ